MEWPWGNEDRGQVQGALAAPGVSEPGLPHTFSQTVHQGQWLDKGSFAARPHHCTDQGHCPCDSLWPHLPRFAPPQTACLALSLFLPFPSLSTSVARFLQHGNIAVKIRTASLSPIYPVTYLLPTQNLEPCHETRVLSRVVGEIYKRPTGGEHFLSSG